MLRQPGMCRSSARAAHFPAEMPYWCSSDWAIQPQSQAGCREPEQYQPALGHRYFRQYRSSRVQHRSGWTYPKTLISNFQRDRWYVLLMVVDKDGFLTRVWERDNPAESRRLPVQPQHFLRHAIRHQLAFQGVDLPGDRLAGCLQRRQPVQPAGYAVCDRCAYPGRSPPRERCEWDICVDLYIEWVRASQTRNLNFEGGASWVGSSTYLPLRNCPAGWGQYGNLTHTIESSWNGSNWQDYRLSWTSYVPNAGSPYLVGLPAYTNQYSCLSGINGGCLTALNSLMNPITAMQPNISWVRR